MLAEIGDLAQLDLRPGPSFRRSDIIIARIGGGGRDDERKEARQEHSGGGKPRAGSVSMGSVGR